MNSLTIDKKANRIIFKDQNKTMVYLIRFVFGLNLVNAIFFFGIFNYQDDIFKWVWLVFALFNLVVLYLSLTKVSVAKELNFDDIVGAQTHSIFGLNFKLKNGKFRKVFVAKDSPEADKLRKLFSKN